MKSELSEPGRSN